MTNPGPEYPGFQQPDTNPYQASPRPNKELNVVGIVALCVAVLGILASFFRIALFASWMLLIPALLLGIVALFLRNKSIAPALIAVLVAICGIVVASVMTILAVSDEFEESATDESDPATSATVPPKTDAETYTTVERTPEKSIASNEPGGSREHPLPLGSTLQTSKWDVTINSVDFHATDKVLAENDSNEVPASDETYIMVNATVKYKGDDPEGATPEVVMEYVTPQGTAVDGWHNIALAPDDLDILPTIYKDGTASGNLAYLVPATNVEDGVLAINPDTDSAKRFVKVK